MRIRPRDVLFWLVVLVFVPELLATFGWSASMLVGLGSSGPAEALANRVIPVLVLVGLIYALIWLAHKSNCRRRVLKR